MGRVRVRVVQRARDNTESVSFMPALASLLGGVVIGYAAWGLQQKRHRQALFHPRPFRRLAALGYLRAHPSVDSARLLHDYLQWEPHPMLRRRAQHVLHRMERILRSY